MNVRRAIFLVLFSVTAVMVVNAHGNKRLMGTWELQSQKIDGKPQKLTGTRLRLVTAKHFVWIQQSTKEVRELLARATPHDSAVAYHDVAGGGTYSVAGDVFTETTEFFYDPANIGSKIDWKFRLEGDLWYTSGHYIHYQDGKPIENLLLEEVWKKLD